MKSEQINELAAALAKAQGEMKHASLDKVNPHFKSKFASLASCVDAAKEPLSKNGLSVVHAPQFKDGGLWLLSTLFHSSGQFVSCELPLTGSTPQQIGAALSYAKRQAFCALVGVVGDEDDDGNAAEKNKLDDDEFHPKYRNPPAGLPKKAEILKTVATPQAQPVSGIGGEYIMEFGASKGLRLKSIPLNMLAEYETKVREENPELTLVQKRFLTNLAFLKKEMLHAAQEKR